VLKQVIPDGPKERHPQALKVRERKQTLHKELLELKRKRSEYQSIRKMHRQVMQSVF